MLLSHFVLDSRKMDGGEHLVGSKEPGERVEVHADELLANVADAATLLDEDACEGVIVAGFDVRLTKMRGNVQARGVLHFDDDVAAEVADAGDVAAVFRPGLDPPVDAVVLEDLGEVVGDLTFEAGAGLAG
jgi:hypothetical protein